MTESFGSDGTAGSFFGAPGSLAFDSGDKRLYVLDDAEQEIYGFDASTPGTHTPLGGNFPLTATGAGFLDGIGVDGSSHDVYFANGLGNTLYGFDEGGNALSGFPIAGQGGPCGVAVDSAGDVWVSERSEGKIREYSPAGSLIETYATGGFPCRLAFDAEDNLYVSFFFGSTSKYSAASGYTSASSFDSTTSGAIATDKATGEVFVTHFEYIDVWNEAGEFLYEFGEPVGGEYGGIAVDEATEELYAGDYVNEDVHVFSPPVSVPKLTTEGASGVSGTEATVHGTINPKEQAVEDCHFEVIPASQFIKNEFEEYENVTEAEKYPCVPAAGSIPADSAEHAVSTEVTGLEPATTYHYRLVAKNAVGEAHGSDRQFTTAPAAPLIEEESVQAVGNAEATLAAKINPRGGQTSFHLEYGTTIAYGHSSAESPPIGSPTDARGHVVSVRIDGLNPATAYHFRFVATNEAGDAEGADASFATYAPTPTPTPTIAPCANDEFRTGVGSRLPDCRAYEQVSPTEKHGANIQIDSSQGSRANGTNSAGDRVSFFANGGLPTTGESNRSEPYLASRGPEGWSTDGLLAPGAVNASGRVFDVTEDFSTTLVQGEGPGGVLSQLLLRDTETATFEPAGLVETTRDYSIHDVRPIGFPEPHHLVFGDREKLLPDALESGGVASSTTNLYDLDHGSLTLLDRIPAGSARSCDDESGAACEPSPEGAASDSRRAAASRDGSRVFFEVLTTVTGAAGRIYLREDGRRTTWISASQRTTPDPNGEKPAQLLGITPDGSRAFFLSCEKLTDDSTAVSTAADACEKSGFGLPEQGRDLYSYDVGTGELTDLTVDSNAADPRGAEVQGLMGTSEDGSYVYFAANGVLAPGAPQGNCSGSSGTCNLYAYHDGATTFLGGVESPYKSNWREFLGRVSADGRVVVFESKESLTGYDNGQMHEGQCVNNAPAGAPCHEYFRYSAPEEKLLCITCNPAGTRPTGIRRLGYHQGGSFKYNDRLSDGPTRNLSADGNRFFFETDEPLVPRDSNSTFDVYEWEAQGEGSCESESQDGGCIYLISSGIDPQPSTFLDASRDGDHVFFDTEEGLVPTDEDVLYDVYDAGVGAGLASQHTLTPPTCTTTACQVNPAPPPEQTPASAIFRGPGNAKPKAANKRRRCPKGKRRVRRRGKVRCVRRRHRRRHHRHRRRHHKRHAGRAQHGRGHGHRRANVNRGGSK